MIRMPSLWTWTVTHWCPLPARLSWVLWRALTQAQWSTAVEWRQTFLDFDAPDRLLSRDLIEDFLAQIATPGQMMDLIEQLRKERCLLRRDAQQVEALLLSHVDREGAWKPQTGRRQMA